MREFFQIWKNESRYYTIHLYKDLFGEWMLERTWGGRLSRRGGEKSILCSSYADGLEKIERLYKLKAKHKYKRC